MYRFDKLAEYRVFCYPFEFNVAGKVGFQVDRTKEESGSSSNKGRYRSKEWVSKVFNQYRMAPHALEWE
jgi:hypothetical protein